jgi:hypothetical protein
MAEINDPKLIELFYIFMENGLFDNDVDYFEWCKNNNELINQYKL